MPHAILDWTGAKPASRIQEEARNARYNALVAHAGTLGADVLLTAHHADDQAETNASVPAEFQAGAVGGYDAGFAAPGATACSFTPAPVLALTP